MYIVRYLESVDCTQRVPGCVVMGVKRKIGVPLPPVPHVPSLVDHLTVSFPVLTRLRYGQSLLQLGAYALGT